MLESGGGALGKILPLYYSFAGGVVGSGKNWFSWIHRDDLVGLITEALRNPKYSGVVNGTAPNPVRFAEFCEQVAKATNRPNLLPVPGFVVRILLGEGATVVLDGQKVLPKCVVPPLDITPATASVVQPPPPPALVQMKHSG